ncbi:MAG: Maf family protein [Lachnospiraceae bacterium]|nr:Maf family protein [Lachnospiraceae bacterium]
MDIENIKMILASKSPRRKEILSDAGYSFDITHSDFELDINKKEYNDSLLLKCVGGKFDSIKASLISGHTNDLLVITADTVVVLNNTIIGKPKDNDDAFNILNNLSDNTHFVATGVQIAHIFDRKIIDIKNDIEKTYVTFRKLSKDDINDYIKKSKPLDKAGAYGIQDDGFDFVTHIDGNIDNVIGFPMTLFHTLLNTIL